MNTQRWSRRSFLSASMSAPVAFAWKPAFAASPDLGGVSRRRSRVRVLRWLTNQAPTRPRSDWNLSAGQQVWDQVNKSLYQNPRRRTLTGSAARTIRPTPDPVDQDLFGRSRADKGYRGKPLRGATFLASGIIQRLQSRLWR
jgi:hypothetical protein